MALRVLHGSSDKILREELHSERLARSFPQARVSQLMGVGHMVHYSRRDSYISAVQAVLQSGTAQTLSPMSAIRRRRKNQHWRLLLYEPFGADAAVDFGAGLTSGALALPLGFLLALAFISSWNSASRDSPRRSRRTATRASREPIFNGPPVVPGR